MDQELSNILSSIQNAYDKFEWNKIHKEKLENAIRLLSSIKLTKSTRRLIIFDLNGVFIERQFLNDGDPIPDCDAKVGKFVMWKRSGIKELFEKLKDYYIAIWSSAKLYNIYQMLNTLFTKEEIKGFYFVWDQEKCLYENKTFMKNLETVWDTYPEFDETNTIIVDDSIEKLTNNPKQTIRIVKSWSRNDSSSAFDLAEFF